MSGGRSQGFARAEYSGNPCLRLSSHLGSRAAAGFGVDLVEPIGIVAPIVAVSAAVLVIAVVAWWVWSATRSPPSSAVAVASSVAQPLVAPRLSIVVLPFANLSNDPDQQ